MKRNLSVICAAFVFLSLLSACTGEKHVYEGTLRTTVVRSGSGSVVGSGEDKMTVTLTKSGNDYATLTFKTSTDAQVKSELDYCTVSLMRLGDTWEEKDSKKCDVEGTEMAFLKGKVEFDDKNISFNIEAVRFGTGNSNNYSFSGKKN